MSEHTRYAESVRNFRAKQAESPIAGNATEEERTVQNVLLMAEHLSRALVKVRALGINDPQALLEKAFSPNITGLIPGSIGAVEITVAQNGTCSIAFRSSIGPEDNFKEVGIRLIVDESGVRGVPDSRF